MSQADLQVVQLPIPLGIQVTVPDNPRLMTPFILLEQGDWFEAEIAFVRRWLSAGMAVVDVGANYGCYSLTSAKLVGPTGRVWAFEPANLPGSCLAHSIQANGFQQVRLSRSAMSDHVGSARLGINDNAELNSLSQPGGAGEEVPLTTLDAECAGWDRPIDFVKLDAEGEEVRILAAATAFFAAHQPLVMFEYKHGAVVNLGLIQAIQAHGMAVYRHVPGLNLLIPLEAIGDADPFLLNIFGCGPARAARLREAGLLVDEPATPVPALEPEDAKQLLTAWAAAHPGIASLWGKGWETVAAPGSDRLLAGLAHALLAEQEATPAAIRLARLRQAKVELEAATVAKPGSAARWYSLSRVSMALGGRQHSLQGLQRIDDLAIRAGGINRLVIDEAFLPPDPASDTLDPHGQRDAALLAMIDEPYVQRVAFSIYFNANNILPVLRRLQANPLRSAAARQRLAAAARILPLR